MDLQAQCLENILKMDIENEKKPYVVYTFDILKDNQSIRKIDKTYKDFEDLDKQITVRLSN